MVEIEKDRARMSVDAGPIRFPLLPMMLMKTEGRVSACASVPPIKSVIGKNDCPPTTN